MNTLSKVMLVEDEPDIREIASLALKEIGQFDVMVCESGLQALEKLKSEIPQLILLDVMMPEIDGPTTLRRIKADSNLKDIPIIFMTARIQPQEVVEYLKLGAIAAIPKPFDPTTLAQEVTNLWNKYNER